MRMRALPVIFVLAAAIPGFARSEAQTTPEAPRDYSNDALLEFVLRNPDLVDEEDGDFYLDGGVVYRRGHWLWRWLPIAAPLVISGAADAHVTLMPAVDPIVMTGTHIPYTKSSFRDRWEERRIRRALRRNVEAANRAEND